MSDWKDMEDTVLDRFFIYSVHLLGRFVHVCVEMGLKLASIEYVVFDEADRLFEG